MARKSLLVCLVGIFLAIGDTGFAMSVGAVSADQDENHLALKITPNLLKGNATVGGNVGTSYSTYSGFIFQVNPTVEFFVADRFSIGGTVASTFSKNFSAFGIGPTATYYFWQQDRWAGFAGAGLIVESTDWQNDFGSGRRIGYIGQMRLGSAYFINPSVSIGPLLTLTKSIDESRSQSEAFGTLMFQFNIHL